MIFAMSLGLSLSLFAQDGAPSPNQDPEEIEKTNATYERHNSMIELENKNTAKSVTSQKEPEVKPSAAPAKNQQAPLSNSPEKEPEKATSSFNLFYYMFQKFKLTDIIEQ